MEVLEGELCPFCSNNTLTLTEDEVDVPYFGRCYVFSMSCSSCKYSKADIEAEESREGSKHAFVVDGDDALKVRVIRSSEGLITIGKLGSIEPGESAEGFISNVEGVLERFKKVVEAQKLTPEMLEEASDEEVAAHETARDIIKKLNRVLMGSEKLTITIEDPSGNSAIISEKTTITPLKPAKNSGKELKSTAGNGKRRHG
jgi:zinc finger protein